MQITAEHFIPSSNSHLLLAYVADLELEVDRLRKQGQFVRSAAREMLGHIHGNASSGEGTAHGLLEIHDAAREFSEVLHDLDDSPGYHPAHDQVTAIAIRPLIEQVFRWQQRLLAAPHAVLHMELATESVDWFPVRLRHILDNLVSNALKYRDPDKGEARVFVGFSRLAESLELRITDNGLGMPWDKRSEAFELFYRSAPARSAGLGVGLSVVKLLVEQCGGSLAVDSGQGQGTSFLVILPRYDAGDFLS